MVVPTGAISLPPHYLKETLAASAAFQAWTGAANAAAARAFIHIFGADPAAVLPLATIDWSSGGYSRPLISKGSTGGEFEGRGTLMLEFFALVTESLDDDAGFEFTNEVGAIITELGTLFGQPGFLDVENVTLSDGPARPEEDEKKTLGDIYWCSFEVEFMSL